jgi:hypothetical protein
MDVMLTTRPTPLAQALLSSDSQPARLRPGPRQALPDEPTRPEGFRAAARVPDIPWDFAPRDEHARQHSAASKPGLYHSAEARRRDSSHDPERCSRSQSKGTPRVGWFSIDTEGRLPEDVGRPAARGSAPGRPFAATSWAGESVGRARGPTVVCAARGGWPRARR